VAVGEFWLLILYRVPLSPLSSGMADTGRLNMGSMYKDAKQMGDIVISCQQATWVIL
jgi:hypothetical protein